MIKNAKYIYVDAVNNNNKFWNIEIDASHTVTTFWGRVGDEGQSKSFPHNSDYAAEAFFNKKCREKENKGYTVQRTINNGASGPTVKVVESHNLENIAKSQIQTNSPELGKLISYLAKANAHSILSQTSMQYNDATGLFSTPLGIVDQEAIDEARTLLLKISDMVQAKDYREDRFMPVLSNYLRIIPQDIGRKRPNPELLYPDLESVQRQNNVLDSLEASLQVALSPKNDGDNHTTEKVFDVKLHTVEDLGIIDRIRNSHYSTRQRMHATYNLDVKKIYEIEIGSMKRAYEEKGKTLGNIFELFHGSRISNILSILHKGLMVPPSNAGHVCGRNFGNYTYFANQSTKSLNYSYGYWDNKAKDNNCFLFIADVALGNYYVPGYSQQVIPNGYDSFWAKAGRSGVQNDEIVVRNTFQANLKYLVEFA